MVDVYLAVGDVGQAMVLISQIIASLDQYPNQFIGIRVTANFSLAMIKFKRGDTLFAYEELVQEILPYTLEHGSKLFKLRVLSLLSKVCFQLANQRLAESSKEEEKSAFDTSTDPTTDYKTGCLKQAANFLKQTLPLALGLNHLKFLRESLYLLSVVNNMLAQTSSNSNENATLQMRRDKSASLFLHVDQFIKQKQAFNSTSLTALVDFDPWRMVNAQRQADQKLRLFVEE